MTSAERAGDGLALTGCGSGSGFGSGGIQAEVMDGQGELPIASLDSEARDSSALPAEGECAGG